MDENTTYKIADRVISIEATNSTSIDTGVVFYSHDKNTAKIRIKLIKNGISQTISQGTVVPILLKFADENAEGGWGKHFYNATIEDASQGIVSIVLTDETLQIQGTVYASVYIEFPNNQSLDAAGKFSFKINRSEIDNSTDQAQTFFYSGFDEITKKYLEEVDKVSTQFEDFNQKISEVNTALENADVYKKQEADSRFVSSEKVVLATDKESIEGQDDSKLVTPRSINQFYQAQEVNRSKFLNNVTNFCAHRGNNSDYPENSLPAFRSVTRHKYVETDIQLTKDKQWVIMHDATVDRMTDGTGRVDGFTFADLRKLKFDSGANLAYLTDADKKVPTLQEVLTVAKSAGRVPMIEIKADENMVYADSDLDNLVNILKQARMLNGGCIVISFNKDILEKMRQRSNELEMMWITSTIETSYLEECMRLRIGIDVAYNAVSLTQDNINAFHEAGLLVGVWTAPDSAFDSLKQRQIDIITTNSKSGDLRWGLLGLDSGFTNNSTRGPQREAFVEEVSPGVARAYFNLTDGKNDTSVRIVTFPDWAIPLYNTWATCNIRTSSGSALATADIMGIQASAPGIQVGLGWATRTSWVVGTVTYPLY